MAIVHSRFKRVFFDAGLYLCLGRKNEEIDEQKERKKAYREEDAERLNIILTLSPRNKCNDYYRFLLYL